MSPGQVVLVETVRFAAPADRDVVLSANVTYRYATQILRSEPIEIEMSAAEQVVPRSRP